MFVGGLAVTWLSMGDFVLACFYSVSAVVVLMVC